MAAGRLQFVDQYEEAIADSEAIFICVGTPALPTGQADTSAVEAAAQSIGECLGSDYCVIINKSTVPVGTGNRVERLLRQTLGQRVHAGGSGTAGHLANTRLGAVATLLATAPPRPAFDVVSNPEFL